jgi:hypothetical protein
VLHSYIESVESKPKSGSSECKNEPSLGEEKTLKVDRLIIKGPAIYLMKKTPPSLVVDILFVIVIEVKVKLVICSLST